MTEIDPQLVEVAARALCMTRWLGGTCMHPNCRCTDDPQEARAVLSAVLPLIEHHGDKAELARLRAALAVAKEALRPFAADAERFADPISFTGLGDDLRRAAAALREIEAIVREEVSEE